MQSQKEKAFLYVGAFRKNTVLGVIRLRTVKIAARRNIVEKSDCSMRHSALASVWASVPA